MKEAHTSNEKSKKNQEIIRALVEENKKLTDERMKDDLE